MAAEEDGRTARKRRQILEAALPVFLRNGYVGTSMDEVAALASVSKQTVYKHFTDKEQLFTSIIMDTTGQVEGLAKMITAALEDTDDLEKDLRELARQFLARIMSPDVLKLRRLVIAEADRFPDLGRTWYAQGFERSLETMATAFGRLAERGLLRTDDPALAAEHFVGLLLWIPVNKAMFSGGGGHYTEADLDRLADAGVAAFLRAYASPGSA
ncbi:Transcriptional regulator, TetR family [[Actinomadura] parvosata subsp. kistnae]|uniref:TetR family transcriptional regulator n=2 Tax=Nonomuraea TaxID=83681 RepID=A0A1V0ADG7_9ACTN|nr:MULTISPECIES: TetR/AcrR family transcriptional regulator [unclassified Nonomuraea]AQZ68162.1 TetR family transcriptional regulator [Nonomuraea sp. ATCC 55076]NJP94167.1 TetR/AcrR family transcriptional regulator [Nonomuraea sp. FMUSA5-5]SPL93445.1 Transcriptional regulator, TetR family [Actinomadura parvosata subsp. kistnae]